MYLVLACVFAESLDIGRGLCTMLENLLAVYVLAFPSFLLFFSQICTDEAR